MSEIELLTSMQSNRAIFVNYVLVQTLMAAVIVYVAFMFRHLPTVVRAAAMVGSIISILLVTFFATGTQTVFYASATTMSEMAGNGSELATSFMNNVGLPAGDPVSQPAWMTVFSVIQLIINLVITIYIFMLAKWGDE